ncbi:DNA repair and genetic recombination protein [Listeria fleischmannii 1991]|uniref:DNA repair protein RecN n=2 Tax=Listeria fleischmannii TaxID=1069827 RepID=A0A2X3J7V0_9LIST|nr:DNA repair protein RecN [Listeria fleischmannii]EMG27572.1 DNA repair and genetic recombination [Listeria fleischmannii subsp. fleischmannii LU2006-1]KMT60591.1 DNA repair and genetic recombination protein [Listeria fleischmannii 1991]SQC69159.1 Recombination protein N [Listeria fleischmannii subsp. fleischmannii]
MLQELTIKNLAIIESLSLSFEEGMTVLTGETGAGKSIIIDALGLLVGGRGSSHFIRHGEDKLSLEGLFILADDNVVARKTLIDNGIDATDNMVVLERTVFKSGKNICRINGKLATTVLLRDVGSKLIDIHSQHEHQELMHDEFHLTLLDRYSGEAFQKPLQAYEKTFALYKKAQKEFRDFTKGEQELAQRLDMLQFQNQEIEAAHLQVGEEETLLAEKNILANFEKLNDNLNLAYNALQAESGGLSATSEAMRQIEAAKNVSHDFDTLHETIASSYYQLEDAAMQIRQALDQIEFQPEQLNQIENRLAEMNQLKRKYGKKVEDIMAYHVEIQDEIQKLANSEAHVGELSKNVEKLAHQVAEEASRLTALRKKAAKQLEAQIKTELGQLYMEKAIFEVHFSAKEEFSETGGDEVVFYMSTNPGEPAKPMTKIASGGELSRMMLALKTIFSKHQGITSIIFDEVDTGVSGRVAQAIAEKIYAVSVGSQVLCITHLPQVAAMADHHYYITKQVENERTSTNVKILKEDEKSLEISRMIAGTEVTELAKQHAEEMLSQASKAKSAK